MEKIWTKSGIIVIIAGMMVVCGVVFGITVNALGKGEIIAKNVWAAGVPLSDMTQQDAVDAIKQVYGNYTSEQSITLSGGGITKTIPLSLVGAEVNFSATAQNAYDIGRSRSSGWFEIVRTYVELKFKKIEVPLEIEMDAIAFRAKIQEFANAVDERNKAYAVREEERELWINTEALDGLVDVEGTYQQCLAAICGGEPNEAQVVTAAGANNRAKAELVRARIPHEPVDATVQVENGEVVFLKEKNGIDFSIDELKNALNSGDESVRVGISIKNAGVTESDLRAHVFRDVLAEYTTNFNEGLIGRSQNVRLAAKNINGAVILPQKNFSFNETVGERTYATGFADGLVFSGGQVIEGVGGGICQTSSTLYCTVLYADLEVVERHNHNFAIAYAPLGQDATVSYGALDFVFKNNTEFPIKVVAETGRGTLRIKILGTVTEQGDEIRIVNNTISTKPFITTTKPNPNTNATKDVVEQAGITGSTVDSYKVYKRDGAEVKRVFLHRSVYVPLEKIVLTPQKSGGKTELPPVAETPISEPSTDEPPAEPE
ncbi:MAG: VanW family protein [Clostridiales bacterium]|nr:VanW family protein [Clostridiales bacterium]